MRTPRRLPAASAAFLAVLALAACNAATGGAATEPAEPTIEAVAITVEEQPANACMEALITGRLVPHPDWGLALQAPGGGELSHPIFPFGYTAARQGEAIVLLDENGRLVARVGDTIQSSGGFIGNELDPLVALCDDTITVVPG